MLEVYSHIGQNNHLPECQAFLQYLRKYYSDVLQQLYITCKDFFSLVKAYIVLSVNFFSNESQKPLCHSNFS